MHRSRLLAGSLAALGLTGCLASKGDIRLLQEELRTTRAAAARSDSLHQHQMDSLSAMIMAFSASAAHGDSILQQSLAQMQKAQQTTDGRVTDLAARERSDQLAMNDRLRTFADEINQTRELARQNVRGVTAATAAVERIESTPPAAAPPSGDSTPRAATGPGPATLMVNGNGAMVQGSCRTARRSYEELLRQYPNDALAAEAQYKVAESFVACLDGGNPAAADSVYGLVVARYPRSDFAGIALYKQAEMVKATKPDSAKALYQRIVCEFPKTTVAPMATEKLGAPVRCK